MVGALYKMYGEGNVSGEVREREADNPKLKLELKELKVDLRAAKTRIEQLEEELVVARARIKELDQALKSGADIPVDQVAVQKRQAAMYGDDFKTLNKADKLKRVLKAETEVPETEVPGSETKVPETKVRTGRPAKVGEPWKAAGMSKAAYYRAKKEGKL